MSSVDIGMVIVSLRRDGGWNIIGIYCRIPGIILGAYTLLDKHPHVLT